VEHKQTGMKKQKSFTVVAAKGISYGPEKQIVFENQLLHAAISAGWLFNSVVDPEVIKLFHSIAPGLKVPDHTKLSNKILCCEVASIEGDIQKSTKGAYATMQNDMWKDVAKRYLAVFMITANCKVCFYGNIFTHLVLISLMKSFLTHVHNMSSDRRTGNTMFMLIEEGMTYLESIGVKLIGVAGDAGGDERKARQLAQQKYTWLLTADCWGHQVCV
jgi:hypothetical protein